MSDTDACRETREHEGRTLVCGKSPRHGSLTGPHRAQHYDKAAELYWSGEYGVYTAQDEHNRHAAAMGDAVASMYEPGGERAIPGEHGGAFRYAGRAYSLTSFPSPPFDTPWAVGLLVPMGATPPLGPDMVIWKADTRHAAIKAMATAMYGQPCPHEYGTGRDSCPGCDAYDAYESES